LRRGAGHGDLRQDRSARSAAAPLLLLHRERRDHAAHHPAEQGAPVSPASLAGKVALVTGASKGIGAGMAKGLAAAGAAVAVAYARDRAGAERVVGEIEESGGRAIAVGADVSRAAEVEAMVAETVRRLGP